MVWYRDPSITRMEALVTAVDGLMLDAKQAIMEEHLRRFHILQQEGRWQEALQQIQVTLSCTTDLLNESLRVLDEFLEPQDGPATDDSSPPHGTM